MRITQYKEFYVIFPDLSFKVLKIYMVPVIISEIQVAAYYPSSVILYDLRKRIVYRLLYKHRITRLGICFYAHSQCKNNTRSLNQPLSFYGPVMMSFHPAGYCVKIFVQGLGVTEYRMSGTFYNRILHIRRCFKVHISYP